MVGDRDAIRLIFHEGFSLRCIVFLCLWVCRVMHGCMVLTNTMYVFIA